MDNVGTAKEPLSYKDIRRTWVLVKKGLEKPHG